jgi:hypothetical protein
MPGSHKDTTNDETRMSNDEGNPNDENLNPLHSILFVGPILAKSLTLIDQRVATSSGARTRHRVLRHLRCPI